MASKRNARAISEGSVKLHQAVGGTLPFDDGTFDKACTVATVCVIADPGAVFREMHWPAGTEASLSFGHWTDPPSLFN